VGTFLALADPSIIAGAAADPLPPNMRATKEESMLKKKDDETAFSALFYA